MIDRQLILPFEREPEPEQLELELDSTDAYDPPVYDGLAMELDLP